MTEPATVAVEPVTRGPFEALTRRWAAKLTTFRRDGTPVTTLVNVAVEGDRAYFRTFAESGKFKRLRNDPSVAVVPSTFSGEPLGPPIRADARLLDGHEASHAAQLIDRKHPFFQGVLVRLAHRLRGYTTRHFELRPTTG